MSGFGEDRVPPDAITCLTAVSMYPGHLECFYRGVNNSLWHRWWYGPETDWPEEWNKEHNLGGFLTSAPAAISTKPHHIDCFYRGKDNHLCQRHWDGEKKRWSSARFFLSQESCVPNFPISAYNSSRSFSQAASFAARS